jgi:diaminohydroxyphosphoribosylaminopyrimidine deaminase/5-amino-6-(5-phosphoribosylamino)uracil reductase
MNTDELYMQRCLQLARLGFGYTRPNPMVGAVIVHRHRIIGEGFHHRAGEPHAEINALASVREMELLSKSTLYVNLEPCSHYGKTPPCSEAVIRAGIPAVVIGTHDSDIRVAGNGIKRLKESGLEVRTGILPGECRELNKRFFAFHEMQRPYIILKWAQSKDGFLDRERTSAQIPPARITHPHWDMLVHQWRTQEDAILVGTNTALLDNPRLSARLWKGKQPLRLVLDRQLRLTEKHHLLDPTQPTLVLNASRNDRKDNIEFKQLSFDGTLAPLLAELYRRQVQSLIVEGGAMLLDSFLREGCWDEARVFTGTTLFGNGPKAPVPDGIITSESTFSGQVLHIYRHEAP